MLPSRRRHRTIERLLFAAAFLTYLWFHQGGGWNQNVRFALVRAIVEEHRFAIDSFLVYRPPPDDGTHLTRVPVRDATASFDGRTYALGWLDGRQRPVPLGAVPDGAIPIAASDLACTGDLAFHAGHFHPAKAPGGSFLAVPAYAAVLAVERAAGIDPDGWWPLTVNAWLTSALSVGLAAALGCVAAFRLALALTGGRVLPSLSAALALAFATPYLPYATAFYEHDVVGAALLVAFWLLVEAGAAGATPAAGRERRARRELALAGLAAGVAAISNYVAAVAVLPLLVYAALRTGRRSGWFVAGGLAPVLLLVGYHLACFSDPFTTSYRHQDPQFTDTAGALLGVFRLPRPDVLLAVTLSPFRGLFYAAPVLLLGIVGLATWARDPERRAEAWTMIAIALTFLLFVSTFNGWHGGWGVGPRYLVPAVPFLAVGAAVGFARWPRLGAVLAAASTASALLVTAVDVQPPVAVADHATLPGLAQWRHDPVSDYAWPLFAHGRAWPLLDAQREHVLSFYDGFLRARGEPPERRAQEAARLRAVIDEDVRSGRPAPLLVRTGDDGQVGLQRSLLSTIAGPVSVNPMGFDEGFMYRLRPPGSEAARWASFNVGELVLEGSRWSLAPLLVAAGALVAFALGRAARVDRGAALPDAPRAAAPDESAG